MDKFTQQALDIVGETGDKLSKLDMMEIDFLLTLGPVEGSFERRGYVMEAISLIINDPNYESDVVSIDDED